MSNPIEFFTKHFVEFLSPGTMFADSSSREVPSWDTALAVREAASIYERHGARPYGFRFRTVRSASDVIDPDGVTMTIQPRVLNKSGTYFINGVVRTLDDVQAAALPDEKILLFNMTCNLDVLVVQTRNSYLHTAIFQPDDAIVDGDGRVVRNGSDHDLAKYRASKVAELEAERERRWGKG